MGLLVHDVMQAEGCVSHPNFTQRLDLIEFNVSGFVDAQSGIKAIRCAPASNTLSPDANSLATHQ
jgi:hypothetical protein